MMTTTTDRPRDAHDLVCSDGTSGVLEVRSPFDDVLVGRLPQSSVADVDRAFDVARRVQPAWGRRAVRERVPVLQRFGELVLAHEEELLDVVQRETGKSRASAFEEIADIVLWASYLGRHGPRVLRDRRRRGVFPALTQVTQRQVPKGVVGVITPWNYPLTLPVTDSLPALLAGNTVVLKPDAQTPHTALRVLSLLREAGLPDGVLQIVLGPGAQIGGALIERADHVVFTGSTATGRTVARQCAERLISCSAELGGKNPMLVLADADVPRAAAGAVHACFSTSGHLCISVERIYVHQSVWEEFTARFVAQVEAMRVASGLTWDADMGSLISADQLATVVDHVEDARGKGARVLAGGRARPDLGPYFYEPTVLTGVTPEMTLSREETFGPVVSLTQVATDDEAVEAANDTDYGLNASVWSRRHGRQVARRIHAGTVNINEGYAAAWVSHDAPMGGVKASGLGRRHGREGILASTESQTIATQRLLPIGGPRVLSHERWADLLRAGVRVLRHLN